MKQSTKNLLFWSPRVLGILFTLFTSIFALDVLNGQNSFWENLLALIYHLIPSTFIVLIALVLAWKWEWIGGIAFIFLPILYVVWVWGRTPFWIFQALIICTPLLIISILFFINWKFRAEIRTK